MANCKHKMPKDICPQCGGGRQPSASAQTDSPRPGWPRTALYGYGDVVQRKQKKDGSYPVPLWRGVIVGWYRNPVTDELGYAIASEAEPGAIQVYQQRYLEKVES